MNVESQRAMRGALSSMIGPVQVRGVSADPGSSVVYVALCREATCSVYAAGDDDRLTPVLADADWDYRWVAAVGGGQILAVRSRPGSELIDDPVSEIVIHRLGEQQPTVLRSEAGRVTSLHSLGGGAFAYFISTDLKPVEGCRSDQCKYVPAAQKLVVVGADGGIAGTMDDVVDGLEGEAFHPWSDGVWVVMPWNTARDQQLPATITGGPSPVLTRYATTAELAASPHPSSAWPVDTLPRFNMVAEPFRVLGALAVPDAIDLTAPGRAVMVAPAAGPRPDHIEVRPVSRPGGQSVWQADPPRNYRF